jgi:hypothetical protein
MLGYTGRHLVIVLAAVLCVVGITSLALIYFFPAPPSTITMAVGFKGGSYGVNAAHYKEILARDHVDLVLRNTAGGAELITASAKAPAAWQYCWQSAALVFREQPKLYRNLIVNDET